MLISYMREDGDELYADGNYLELPMLQRGLLWGVGKLCQLHADEMNQRGVFNDVAEYLKSSDATVVGLAIIALGQLGNPRAISLISSFIVDDRNVVLFERGQNVQMSLGTLAQTTVNHLQTIPLQNNL